MEGFGLGRHRTVPRQDDLRLLGRRRERIAANRDWPQRGAAMLVLSRKKNESIIINDNIVVTVIEIRGDKVRLGIEAPKDVTVHRREVYEAIHGQGPLPAKSREHDPNPAPVTPDAGVGRSGE